MGRRISVRRTSYAWPAPFAIAIALSAWAIYVVPIYVELMTV